MAMKFICNGMLGKLCKLLRICGIDAAYSNQGMAILLEARKENRIVLTRNTRLQTKKGVFFVQTFDEFALCPNCHRVYWKGSHYKNMTKDISNLLPNAK
jgi:uncharacterized protein with PIN domain